MNKPVTFEIAKLLKEKGFDIHCREYYIKSKKKVHSSIYFIDHNEFNNISAPTIAEVVMWLYKKHGIWIDVRYMDDILNFGYTITTIKDNTEQYGLYKFNYPQQAYSAAFDYILLNNII